MRPLSLLCISLLLGHTLVHAENNDDLDKMLEEATTIATKTKLNADYVPGTVSVISGEKLKSLGINNLAEQNAFDMIVGFDSSTLSLRGAGSIYGSQGNKIKWMINDKPISSELWGMPKLGVGQIVFPIPTDAVDRIEIVRGPGSAIYGGNAIYGVVNIITKKESGTLFSTLSQTESNKYGRGIGAYGTLEKKDLEISAIVSVEKHDGWDLIAKSQSRHQSGNLPNATENNLFMGDVSYKNFDFWFYRLQPKNDYSRVLWDPTNYLPQDNTNPVQSNTYTMLGVQGKFDLPSNVLLTAKAGLNRYENFADVMFYPASILGNNPNHLNGMRTINYIESTKYAEATLETTIGSNRILGGAYAGFLSVDQDDVIQTWSGANYHPGRFISLLTANNPKRVNKALYLQDEIQLDDSCTATLGTRYDTYDDGRHALSPRIAFVYLYDEFNIFKSQYSRAFRPPSFSEQFSPNNYPNQRFNSETVDTFELSYIHKQRDTAFKATALYSKTSDMITIHNWSYETINLSEAAIIKGLEIEFAKNFDTMILGTNFAYYKTHQGAIQYHHYDPAGRNYGESEFALSAHYLANFYMTINSDTSYPTTLWYHYTGNKPRVSTNLVNDTGNVLTNGSINGFIPVQDYVNITQKVNGITKNLDLEFGIKNVFGKTLRTLYFPLNPPDTTDVPYMGQTFWVKAVYTF